MVKSRKGGKTRRRGGNRKRKSRRGGRKKRGGGFWTRDEPSNVEPGPTDGRGKMPVWLQKKLHKQATQIADQMHTKGGRKSRRGGNSGFGAINEIHHQGTMKQMLINARKAANKLTHNYGPNYGRGGGRKSRRGGRKKRGGGFFDSSGTHAPGPHAGGLMRSDTHDKMIAAAKAAAERMQRAAAAAHRGGRKSRRGGRKSRRGGRTRRRR